MELQRRTGISRARLRNLKKCGFVVKPNGHTGRKASRTVLTGFTAVIDNLLRSNVSNSAVCYDRLRKLGYQGGISQIKVYIKEHSGLIPPKRQIIDPQGNRGRRYTTGPGEAYQMDWGFVNVDTAEGLSYKAACFAMICHHCGMRYVEFFPNAKQENLFIGMIHAFAYMGVPNKVLTDNMKSVVISRDPQGQPVWQKDYESFMKIVGFETKLCKPRHPFTKGSVERLVRFVKGNFLAGRVFGNITDLNCEAEKWCREQNMHYHKAVDCIPSEKHQNACMTVARPLQQTRQLAFYLCPERRISFDGFVNYEGRRFGIPYWYGKHVCRVSRKGFYITVYTDDLNKILTQHDVTWSRRDSFCRDQYVAGQPEEFPTMPVKTQIYQKEQPEEHSGFEKFDFGKGLWHD